MTPNEICNDVRFLVSKLDTQSEPIFLPCRPELGAPVNECFPIVDTKVKSSGGKSVLE